MAEEASSILVALKARFYHLIHTYSTYILDGTHNGAIKVISTRGM